MEHNLTDLEWVVLELLHDEGVRSAEDLANRLEVSVDLVEEAFVALTLKGLITPQHREL